MDLIVLADPTVFHPIGDPPRSIGCERPAGRRIDELLPGGLGMVDCHLQVFAFDPPTLNKTLNFLGNAQTYLLVFIHLFLIRSKISLSSLYLG
jgi:hypothetical protein